MADIEITNENIDIQEIDINNISDQEIIVEQEEIQGLDVAQEENQDIEVENQECAGGVELFEPCPLKTELEAAINSKVPQKLDKKLPIAKSLYRMDRMYLEGNDGNTPSYVTLAQLLSFIADGGVDGSGSADLVRGISSIELTSSEGRIDTYTIYYTDGTEKPFTITNGKDGEKFYITHITQSTADGGNNFVNFSDGNTLIVKNGSQGQRGVPGRTGVQGERGEKGEKGDKGDTYTLTDVDKAEIAKIVSGYGITGKLTDLLGTTWRIRSGWKATAGDSQYLINCKATVGDDVYSSTVSLFIGYTFVNEPSSTIVLPTAQEDSIVFAIGGGRFIPIDSSQEFILEITGGNQVTNTDLIAWLYEYGELYMPYQTKIDIDLETESKEIVGAINELNSKIPKESIVGTWKLNEAIAPSPKDFGVHFTNNGEEYYAMEFGQDGALYYSVEMTDYSMEVYDNNGWLDDLYRTIEILEELTDTEFITWLKANATKQVVDLSNLATVDKVTNFNFASGNCSEVGINSDGKGVEWKNDELEIELAPDNEGNVNYHYAQVYERIPIVAGNNIDFEVDEENQVVKINATGGGTPDNVVMNYKVEVESSTTVADMIATIQGMGADISKFNVVTLYGYQSATLGMQINHYGGNVYNINAINLMTGETLSNTTDWSGVGVGNFLVMFKGVIPYCDSSNEGQVLMVVNGVPTWVTL